MARTESYTPDDIIKALQKHKGLIYQAAKTLKCTPKTVYTYIENYPEIKEALDLERGLFVDKAEDKLSRAIDNGEAWAIALVLKTLGKSRGYVEKIEQETSGDLIIKIVRGNANDSN